MTVYFKNCCRHTVILSVDDENPILLQPYGSAPVVCMNSDNIKVSVKLNNDSYIKKGIYYLVIKTDYFYSNVSDGEAFTITREKIRFSLKAFYNRLFLLATNASVLSESHQVTAKENIIKKYKKSKLMHFLLLDPLDGLPGAVILLIIIGLGLTYFWGWKFAIIYFPLAYLTIISLNWIIDKIWKAIFKRAFIKKNDNEDFYNYFENEFIKNYYSDLNRTPFMGNVEIN